MEIKIHNINYDLFEIVRKLFADLGIQYTNYMLIDGQSSLSTALRMYSNQEPIDEEYLDELAHNHCMNSGYSGLDDNDYINDETLTWGDIMKDIKRAYKSGYHKAMEVLV